MKKQSVEEHKLVTAPPFEKYFTGRTWAYKAVKNINNISAALRTARYISGHIVPTVLVSGSAKSAMYGMLIDQPWSSEFT